MKFLSARWKHLLFANYVVDRDVLAPFVPQNTAIDSFNGHVFVSLVAFLFEHTHVLGIPIPFHQRFEEANLRFYVTPNKDPSIRAVTFIKEIVPKPAIPLIANSLFSENYVALPMRHGSSGTRYWYTWGKSEANRFTCNVENELTYPAPGSVGEFITEHYWGYAKGRSSTLEYRVTHSQWRCCDVMDFEVDVDFADLYGPQFGFLTKQKPYNVQYAEGSCVNVSFPGRV